MLFTRIYCTYKLVFLFFLQKKLSNFVNEWFSMKIFTFVRLIEIDRNDEYFTLKNKLNFVSPFF